VTPSRAKKLWRPTTAGLARPVLSARHTRVLINDKIMTPTDSFGGPQCWG
jgi:hypothetical protein